ncbi:N-6 DNA methylase [Kiloniella litopenaei]|uniref:N-6 DNA methylase n=1 Tax=Kiloniella litopenaei TaxID=1549748 RepID=UPI00069658D4|nr:N-6 DNA methylase [Kiloniella litopenaei]
MGVKDFVKVFNSIDHSKDNYTKFNDFLTLAYSALAKKGATGERAEALEADYMKVVGRYKNKEDITRMSELMAMTFLSMGQRIDFLGSVAGELEILNSNLGQFFTPYSVCRLMAGINFAGCEKIIEEKGFITVSEPACGAGAMLLALADDLEDKGFDPMTDLWVEATDVAEMPYRMCFIQLSCRGLSGRIWRGNTLSMEMQENALLLSSPFFFEKNGSPFPKNKVSEGVIESDLIEAPVVMPQPVFGNQLSLF